MIITPDDTRAIDYCARGIRAFFKEHHLDYGHYVEHGIDSDILLKFAPDNHMVQQVVEAARGRILK